MNSYAQTQQKYSLKTLEIASFFLTCLLGVLFHFIYEWTGKQFLVGLFFPVNESTWEHLKLVFFPIILVSILEYYVGNLTNAAFICIKLRSALLGMLTTVILFYTYTGVLGKSLDWVNISIFFVAIAISFFYSYQQLLHCTAPQNDHTLHHTPTCSYHPNLCLLFFFAISILFMIFTVFPPDIGLFRAP